MEVTHLGGSQSHPLHSANVPHETPRMKEKEEEVSSRVSVRPPCTLRTGILVPFRVEPVNLVGSNPTGNELDNQRCLERALLIKGVAWGDSKRQ